MSNVGLGRDGGRFVYNNQPWFVSAIDCETLVADTRTDYPAILDLLCAHGFNKIRLWAHCWLGIWTGPQEVFLRPWMRVDAPGGTWSECRWDLDTWDDAYWARLRAFCAAAQARDMVVEISLFAEWTKDFHEFHVRGIRSNQWWQSEIFCPVWNRRFNVNGAFSANAAGHFWPEFCTLDYPERSTSGRTLHDYQQAYLDKTLAEVDAFPNVYYELFNEFPGFPPQPDEPPPIHFGAAWQAHWAHYLKEHSRRLVGVSAHQIGPGLQRNNVGAEHFTSLPFIDVLNFHWYNDDPREVAWAARPLLASGKILTNNEGAWHGVTGPAVDDEAWADRETRSAWAGFMAGVPYSMTEFPPDVGCPRWRRAAERFAALRAIAETLRFWQLSPVDEHGADRSALIGRGPGAQWRLLANPPHEYLAYFWGDPAHDDVAITLPTHIYDATWLDPRDASELGPRHAIDGSPFTSIPAPSRSSFTPAAGLVLRLLRK